MANQILRVQGTTIVWNAGGDEALTLASLANNAGRAGDEHDFGEVHPSLARVEAQFDPSVAPTAGKVINIYWSSSADGTLYDGECGGSDVAYSAEEDTARLYPVGSFVFTASTNTQRQSWILLLPARYGLPVVFNLSGQALTATEADHYIKVTPLIDEAQ